MAHIICRLIREAERARELTKGQAKPKLLPRGWLDDGDLRQLKHARIIYFQYRVAGIRRLRQAQFSSERFRANTLREEITKLTEEMGVSLSDLPHTFRADVLDEDRDAMALVELWFLEKQEA